MLAYGSNSLTWRSDHARLHAEFRSIQVSLNRMRFDRSPFIPRSLQEYIQHKEEFATDRLVERRSTLEQMDQDTTAAANDHRNPFSLLAGDHKSFLSERTRCVALESVWSPLWEPTEQHPRAPWPSPEEAKEEGDERHTSGFGRYLPIPRVPGNDTVAWKQKNFVEMHQIDKVRPVARRYAVDIPGDYEDTHEPMEDNEGHIIDDPDEHGRTATVEELRSRLKAGSSELMSNWTQGPGVSWNSSDSSKHNDITHPGTFNLTTGKSSELNPGAANFAPRSSLGLTGIDTGHTRLNDPDSCLKDGGTSYWRTAAQANKYELLAIQEDSDGASRTSREKEAGDVSSKIYWNSDDSQLVDKTALCLLESKPDIAFELPGYLIEENGLSKKPLHSTTEAKHAEIRNSQAIDEVIRDYHLPALNTVVKAIQDSQNHKQPLVGQGSSSFGKHGMKLSNSDSRSGSELPEENFLVFPNVDKVATKVNSPSNIKIRNCLYMERRDMEIVGALTPNIDSAKDLDSTFKSIEETSTGFAREGHHRRLTYVSELNSDGEWRISSVPLELRTPGSGYRLINQGLNQALLRHMGRGMEVIGFSQTPQLQRFEGLDEQREVLEQSISPKENTSSFLSETIDSKHRKSFKSKEILPLAKRPGDFSALPAMRPRDNAPIRRSMSPDIEAGPGPIHEDFTAAGGKTIDYIANEAVIKPDSDSLCGNWLNRGEASRRSPNLEDPLTQSGQRYTSDIGQSKKAKHEDEDVVLFRGRRAYSKHSGSYALRTALDPQESIYNPVNYGFGGYRSNLRYENDKEEPEHLSLNCYSQVDISHVQRGQEYENSGYDAREYEAADPGDSETEFNNGDDYENINT